MAYSDMSVDDVRTAVEEIKRSSRSVDEVKRRIRQELGYEGSPVVTGTSTSHGPMTMWMFMVMMSGPKRESLIL